MTASDSVFPVTSAREDNKSFGAAFVVRRGEDSTWFATCAHVVEKVGGEGSVLIDGKKAVAIPPRVDSEQSSEPGGHEDLEEIADLALLKIDRRFDAPSLRLARLRNMGNAGILPLLKR